MKQHTSDISVTILMAVYNGAPFLNDQLNSIAAQSHPNWQLICSDDHSTDHSTELIAHFSQMHPGKVTIVNGPGQGFAANFMSLVRRMPTSMTHTCFSDQDDIWKPDKLARALMCLQQYGPKPTLYCGRHDYWYPPRTRTIASPLKHRPFTLRNALIENVASGNTIMLNPSASRLAQCAAKRTQVVFAHDWWLYLLMTACDGTVIFDNGPPKLLYRQHDLNLIGAGTRFTAQMNRKIGVLRGAFSRRIDSNLSALRDIEPLLTDEARAITEQFSAARKASVLTRLKHLQKVGPYRQHTRDSITFWGAAGLGYI